MRKGCRVNFVFQTYKYTVDYEDNRQLVLINVLIMDETVRLTMATSFGKIFRIIMGQTGWGEKSIFCRNLWRFWS